MSVGRWFARARDGGPAALPAHPGPGAPPKLSAAQKRPIPEFLWHGAEAYFLQHLPRVAGERLLVIWDGSPIHRRAPVREFVVGTRGKVWLEALPGYAPT